MKALFADDDYADEIIKQRDEPQNAEMEELGASIREQREYLPPEPGEEDESFIMAEGGADFEQSLAKQNFNIQHESTIFDDEIPALLKDIDENNRLNSSLMPGEVSITATDGNQSHLNPNTSLMLNQHN